MKKLVVLFISIILLMFSIGCSSDSGEVLEDEEIPLEGAIPRIMSDRIVVGGEGEWDQGEFSGRGSIIFLDGKTYEGEISNNHRSGNGSMKLDSGEIAYEGSWQDDTPLENGKVYIGDSYFEGSFSGYKVVDGTLYSSASDGTVVEVEIIDGNTVLENLASNNSIKRELEDMLEGVYERGYVDSFTDKSEITNSDMLEMYLHSYHWREYASSDSRRDNPGVYVDYSKFDMDYFDPEIDNWDEYWGEYYWNWRKIPSNSAVEFAKKNFDYSFTPQEDYQKFSAGEAGIAFYRDGYYYLGLPSTGWEGNMLSIRDIYRLNTGEIVALAWNTLYIKGPSTGDAEIRVKTGHIFCEHVDMTGFCS